MQTKLADNLAGLSLSDVSRLMQSRKVTPAQLTQACLERIKTYNSKINSYITGMSEDATKQAADLDCEARAGDKDKRRGLLFDAQRRHLLHGQR